MRRFMSWAAAVCLLLGTALPGLAKEKAGADDLIKTMQRATARIGKQVKAGLLKPGESKHKGFLGALKALSRQVDDLEASCTKKESKFFRHLHKTGEAVAVVEVCWKNCGIDDAATHGAVKKLVDAFAALRRNFGPETVRLKKKQALDGDDQKKIADLKKQNAELKTKLDALQKQVKGEPSLAGAVAGFLTELTKIMAAEWTLQTYLDNLILEEALLGHWQGWYIEVEILYPTWLDEFQVVAPCVVEIEEDYVEVIEEIEIVEADLAFVTVDVEVEVTLTVEGVTDAEVESLETVVEEVEVEVDVEIEEEGDAKGDDDDGDDKDGEMPGGDDDDKGGDEGGEGDD